MRTLFRWALRIVLLLVVLAILLVIAALLLKDTFAKSLAEKNLRDSTGMDARIAKFEVGLLTPTVNMEGLRIYNTAAFGGGTFLDMPELRIEYDPDEVRKGKVHLKVVRLHIAEVNVVVGKDGKSNVESIQKEANKKTRGEKKKTDKPGVDFGGIDTLYVTMDKINMTDMRDPKSHMQVNVALKDEVAHDLKTEADVANWLGMEVLKLYIRQSMTNPNDPGLRSLFDSGKKKRAR